MSRPPSLRIASVNELASMRSIIENSSTIILANSNGLELSYSKPPFSAEKLRRRWQVLAALPVTSASLLAARPVGAARPYVTSMISRAFTTTRCVVDLPVPGPPVMIDSGWMTAITAAAN
ncbi:hypothetical protein D3C71_489210 [compost metagenome]